MQRRFADDPDFPRGGDGQDPVIAQSTTSGPFRLPGRPKALARRRGAEEEIGDAGAPVVIVGPVADREAGTGAGVDGDVVAAHGDYLAEGFNGSLIISLVPVDRSKALEEYGLERHREYCAVNKRLSEQMIRNRIGLLPDGEQRLADGTAKKRPSNIVDAEWAATEWTVPRAIRTARFWWLAIGYFAGGWIWYSVQIHQTKYLVEIGFDPMLAAWSLGVVGMAGIPGQIVLGALSDRFGRELAWSLSGLGFAICYVALLLLAAGPSQPLLWLMVLSQGLLGYAVATIMGPIVAEIFEGARFGSIFSLLMVALIGGGAAGPFVTGLLHDRTGTYTIAFALGVFFSVVCAVSIWIAAPRKVRVVARSLG